MTDLKNRSKLILKYPASWWSNMWRDALPSGNGNIGASVYGGVQQETILINHDQLYHYGRKDPLPDVSHTLQETRNLMQQGEYQTANSVLADALKEAGYQSKLSSPLPVADLKVFMPTKAGFKHYERTLNMETGEVMVSWQDGVCHYQRSLFVSRPDDLIVYEITAQNGLVNCDLQLDLHDQPPKEYQHMQEIRVDDQYIYYAVSHQDETDFGAVARVINTGGTITAQGQKLTVQDAQSVLVLVKVFIKGEREQAWAQLRAELASEPRNYADLLDPHAKQHGDLFNSIKIRLNSNTTDSSNEELLLAAYQGEAPLELVEKMWAYGRYLFISATRPGGNPCHMYGLWIGSYKATWSHFMANENVQMIYWHALTGGLTDVVPALFDYYYGLIEDFRENAQKLFGCRGIYIPAGTTPGHGTPNQIVPVILNWTGAAGWLSQHFYDYWVYTGDDEFLRTKALPFMKEVALFYEDFLQKDDDGYLQVSPSVSPENSPKNFVTPEARQLGHPMPSTINATMDIAIIKELLGNLVTGSKAMQLYADEIATWENMLTQLPPYQVNAEGAVREWLYPEFEDNYNHRHLSHLYPVFPGREVSSEQDEELFKAFETAVQKRLVVGISDQSGWSLTHLANTYARLRDGDSAIECLDLLARSCIMNNFMTLHNDWRNMGLCLEMKSAPIQIDANLGWTAAIQEMLLYSEPGLVRILSACPEKWSWGQVQDLRFCTGKVSFCWNKQRKRLEATLYAERDTEIMLGLPSEFGEYEITATDGEIAPLEQKNYWQVKLVAGGQCNIVSNS